MDNNTVIKFPLSFMEELAKDLMKRLQPFCNKIEIAGSIRRQKKLVKDIELVIIPKIETVKETFGLFNEEQVINKNLLDDFILSNKHFSLRLNKNGHSAYGERNKLLLYNDPGSKLRIPLDIFIAEEHNFTMVKFIRTGGAKNNTLVATRALQRNYELKQYENGFRNRGTQKIELMHSEEQIYKFLGLNYIRPEDRE